MLHQDVSLNELLFDQLPDVVLFKIASYLDLAALTKMTQVNQSLYFIVTDNLFWEEKYKQHFLSKEISVSWYNKFRQACEVEYLILPENIRKLFFLVKEGHTTRLKGILKLEDLDHVDQTGTSLLTWIRKKNNQELLNHIYQLVIDKDPFVSSGKTALHWAILCRQLAAIDSLIAQGENINVADRDGTPLFIAAQDGHLHVVDALLAKGADVNAARTTGATPLFIAAQNGHLDVVNVLLANGAHVNAVRTTGATPLFIAAQNRHLNVVNALLTNGAHVNAARITGATPLFIAAQMGHLDIVNALLTNGAHVNAARTSDGTTPIYIAVQNRHLDVVNALLAKKVNVNVARTNDGATPLFIAIQNGYFEIVNVLLINGADVNAAHISGETPLHVASRWRKSAQVRSLLNKNANAEIINNLNQTSIGAAAKNASYTNELKWFADSAKVNRRQDNNYRILGHRFNLGMFKACRAQEKKTATPELKSITPENKRSPRLNPPKK